jgi:hypothetical protein
MILQADLIMMLDHERDCKKLEIITSWCSSSHAILCRLNCRSLTATHPTEELTPSRGVLLEKNLRIQS